MYVSVQWQLTRKSLTTPVLEPIDAIWRLGAEAISRDSL